MNDEQIIILVGWAMFCAGVAGLFIMGYYGN